jgi:hypothetical protein
MAQIQPVTFPIIGDATELEVTLLPFTTAATTAGVYYRLKTAEGKDCLTGNYYMTEQEFSAWGQDNSYVDDLVANAIGVTIVPEN